jgi:amino acid adenylation domain-containing protein
VSVNALLKQLADQGVELWFEGERLRFRAPKGALSAEQRAQLMARKPEVLTQLRANAVAVEKTAPLSFSQRSLWFLHQASPASAAYNVCFSARIASPVEEAALRQALQALSDRHASLRTTFPLVDGMPVQRVHGAATAVFVLHDVRGYDEARLLEVVTADYRRPFDLEHGPVFRTALFTRAPQDHVLLLSIHHIAADGWSILQLIEELRGLCVEANGGASPAPERAAVEYTEFADWQARMLASEAGKRLADYWCTQMAAPRAELELPSDRPRPPLRSTRGATFAFDLDADASARVRKLARDEGTTVFVAMLAAFKTLLFRYTGTEDIVIGTPTFGRNRPEFARVIGDFVNTVPLRVRLDAQLPFKQLMERVKQSLFSALDAQDYPFPLIVEQLRPVRDPSRSPLFEILFSLQRFDQLRELEPVLVPGTSATIDFGGLRMGSYALDQQEGQFDLTLQVVDWSGPISLQFRYNADLFDEGTIARLSGHYRVLLDAVSTDPSQRIGRLPLLTRADERLLLDTWNATAVEHDRECCVHELLERTARARPDLIAAVDANQSLTYLQLDQHANRLAHLLRERGVRPGELVAICLDRTLDMPVALAAILKAGAAYVPLDPTHPSDRLCYMLEDAGVSCVITLGRFASLVAGANSPLLLLDEAQEELARQPVSALAASSRPEDRAYVIYTSGSTGRPKGVEVEHRNVVSFLDAMRGELGFGVGNVLLAVTTLSFDIAGLEMWLPLSVGGRIVIASRTDVLDGHRLAALMDQHRVTLLQATPATWRLLLEAGWAGRPDFKALCGGEALQRDLANALLKRVAELWNVYGPTETTIWSTVARLRDAQGTIPIGHPIANTRVYVLEPSGQPAPIGVAGELCIAGEGVARGYRNRPELTTEKFVTIALPNGRAERVYRTGDLVRFRADGQLEFIGRRDNQVKVRGYRIELGEIEARLTAHEAVRQAVVVAREAAPGDLRLVAYVVYERGQELTVSDVRRHLRRDLPDHMVPSLVVALESIPLTPNGKVDRAALPIPRSDDNAMQRSRAPPQTATELVLAEIWCAAVGLSSVSRDDDFFGLGGHSLLATQVVSRIREVYRLELPVRALFEASTLEGFAQRVDAALAHEHNALPIPAITVVNSDGPMRLSFSQERMWLIQTLAPENLAYNLPAAMRLRGDLDVRALSAALDELRRRHESLRTTYRLLDGVPVQEVQPWASEALKVVDLRSHGEAADSEALRLAETEACRVFDLSRGPVIRCVLFRIGESDHLLLTALHHIACDQWSFGLLSRELASLYNDLRAGRAPTLAPLTVRYRDFAAWQRKWLQGDELERQMDYWLSHLKGLPPLELPTDRPRPAMQTFNGSWCSSPLPQGFVERIEDTGRREGATLFMVMYAAFATLMHRLTGQTDIAVGVPIANRNQRAIEGLVGVFINTLVMRADLSGAPSFRELLHRVRSTALDAYAHQDAPFEQLVERLGRRDTSRAPLVQIMFNVQNARMHDLHFDGLQWQSLPLDRGAAQAELSFTLDTQISRSLIVEYNSDLFDRTSVERLVGQYFELLDGAVARPDAQLSALPLLPLPQQEQLRAWNRATTAAYPANTSYPKLFEAQVKVTPDAVAVSFKGVNLSYLQLNTRANQLAWHLRSLGVGPGVLVGLCMHRGLKLPVALMGIQKAGGTYVPLDPGFPADRRSFMLEDSGAAVLVTAGDAAASVKLPPALRVLDIEDHADLLTTLSTTDPEGGAGPRDAAYVIYTSGSTGRPKGVAVPHSALVNLLLSMRHSPGLSDKDVIAAVTTISFDIAGLELYLPWLVGARVELVASEIAADGVQLAALLKTSQATVLQATPATWRLLIEAEWRAGPDFRALCGGEALPRELADTLLDRVGELWNLYGPTETTIWSTAERVERGEGPITIGRPIGNTQVYIVGGAGEPTPIGVPGEIWIGGAGVALGYHNRMELTAERFIADPFAVQPGARLYRTGDLGRWREDGRIEHLGRIDHQVKIRGFRVELGEIEARLTAHEAVRQAVVVAREAAPGDLRLIAYVVYERAQQLTVSDVRRHLRRDLPDHMIPSLVVALESIPLTPNGKVDRAALPDPFKHTGANTIAHAPLATPMEELIGQFWRELLKVERIGAEDNFFDLGGHSLLTLRVAAAIEERTGWRMDPRTHYFQNLRQIAATVSGGATQAIHA